MERRTASNILSSTKKGAEALAATGEDALTTVERTPFVTSLLERAQAVGPKKHDRAQLIHLSSQLPASGVHLTGPASIYPPQSNPFLMSEEQQAAVRNPRQFLTVKELRKLRYKVNKRLRYDERASTKAPDGSLDRRPADGIEGDNSIRSEIRHEVADIVTTIWRTPFMNKLLAKDRGGIYSGRYDSAKLEELASMLPARGAPAWRKEDEATARGPQVFLTVRQVRRLKEKLKHIRMYNEKKQAGPSEANAPNASPERQRQGT